MNKFNFLRNLAKMAKIENKKVDYDTELPEKMREEVYKKGIGNILKLSNFLKYKNNISKDNLLNRSGSSKKKQKNRIKNEINDYLKYNEQVKKYDSGNNIHINTKDKLTEVNEVNEQKEVSNRNNSHIGFNEEEIHEGDQGVNYGEEPINDEPMIPQINNNTDQNMNTISSTVSNQRKQLQKLKQNNTQKRYVNEEPIISKPIQKIDLTEIKSTLSSMIKDSLLKSYDNFEKQISNRLYDMETRLNDIYLRLTEYKAHPNIVENNNLKSIDTIESNEYHINNERFKTIKQQNSFVQATEKTELNRDMIYQEVLNDIRKELSKKQIPQKEEPNTDSQITKTWKNALYQIENGNPNEGYNTILNSGDDIYLLRLVCITGPIFDQLSPEIAKRILMRINMISRSHQIQSLLINLIKASLDNNVFNMLNQNEQNDLLDSLFEFSGLNTKIGAEAAELYTLITK